MKNRFVFHGNRIDNGEPVSGNLVTNGERLYIHVVTDGICVGSSRDQSINENFIGFYAHRIDPASLKYDDDINEPQRAIMEAWSPSRCPRCDKRFYDYEPCDDGCYDRAYALERCPYCGQKLSW